MTGPVVETVLDLVGGTPLVRLRRIVPRGAAAVWAKMEHLNPGGSVKDRIALSMLDSAEASGALPKGGAVVEPTSGNTGIGLAIVCAVRGHPLTLTMPESMSLERRALLEAYGAKTVLTPADQAMDGAVREAERLVRETNAYAPRQFDNPANPTAHAATTAREILDAMAGQPIAAFVAAVGTGGTISGVGRALAAANPATKVVAVEPATSAVLSGRPAGPTKLQGIGAGFVPANFDRDAVDEIRTIEDRVAYDMKQRLAHEEGLLVGITSGANVAVAIDVARHLGPDAHVVTILCDTGERYFSLDEHFATPSAG